MEYIDLRDLKAKEKKVWKKAIEDQTGYDFNQLVENEPTMIPETEWRDYARQYADDVMEIPDSMQYYFDYNKFTDDLENDYSEVEVDGITYYFRSF